jgi:Fe-S-cluster-containing hydrogenase component 2
MGLTDMVGEKTVKTNKRQFVSVDPSKCTGCSICEYACALEKDGTFNPLLSRIRVMRLHPLVDLAVTCRFCEDAPCVKACPRNALKQSEENGVILIEEEKCDACGWCIPACPYGVIMLHPEKKVVMVCDLCDGEPQCIDFCPEDALELVTNDSAAQKTWVSAVDKRFSEAEKLIRMTKSGRWEKIFSEANEKLDRLEEKLKTLSRKKQEIEIVPQQ